MTDQIKPRRKARVYAHLTEAEYDELTALAKQANLTISETIRRLVIGKKLPDANRHHQVLELVNVNADLARLGNLQRMYLSDPDLPLPENMDLEELCDRIEETRTLLKRKIEEL